MKTPTPKSLRILVLVPLPWDERLGAVRIFMELAEQWRAGGHTVEHFSLSDAYPGVRATRITFAVRQLIFIRKAAAFVRQNRARFDVIDALVGTLPFTNAELGFSGIIVTRSVGLYLLYDRFERMADTRWARASKGKLAGRLLYGFTSSRLRCASERSIRCADLLNVPNEEEATCLRDELRVQQPIAVLPYGLTEERRWAFASAAAATDRLRAQRICFIGMWSARKGRHDWAAIINHVRRELPGAQFRFLGTMAADATVRADLGAAAAGVELVSEYNPDDLPRLLADCTVGAFPSYVEGFGLAVMEQLASGLPTVAYDTAGPRDMLARELPELLVPSGDVEQFAGALVRILRSGPDDYRQLAERSRAAVAELSWAKIADDTLRQYQEALARIAQPIAFVQPFSVGSAGGGARILRALIAPAPFATRSICCSPEKPKPWQNEIYVRTRPSWGRIERTRLASLPKLTEVLFRRAFRRKLRRSVQQIGARAVHAVPHAGLDFVEAQRVAQQLGLPFFISVHDDVAYTAAGGVSRARCDAAMRRAWNGAAARFVISDALGAEYCKRYGTQRYHVVTDGLTEIAPAPAPPPAAGVLRIYFMGLFHMAYEANLRALLDGVVLFEQANPHTAVSVTLRCEHVRPQVFNGTKTANILPFGDEAQVQRDLAEADLLYMPIPFGREHTNFARYSLSTKMVTYLGSGVPILYHGPADSAAFQLLTKHDAAVASTSTEAHQIARVLGSLTDERRAAIATNALRLAASDFMLDQQTERFWRTIRQTLTAHE
jgi:glycosyltransferase involved in cell wall biosynthesis